MKKENIYIELMDEGKIPVYANYNDAGADVFAAEDLVIRPMEKKIIPLNFKVALPDHIEIQVRPRSGLTLKTSIRIPNSPGTVDAGYRNPVGVIVENTYNLANLPYEMLYDEVLREKIQKEYRILTPKSKSEVYTAFSSRDSETPETLALVPFMVMDRNSNPYGTLYIEKGTKIAQVVFNEVVHADFILTEDVSVLGTNRGGGYGSTGLK